MIQCESDMPGRFIEARLSCRIVPVKEVETEFAGDSGDAWAQVPAFGTYPRVYLDRSDTTWYIFTIDMLLTAMGCGVEGRISYGGELIKALRRYPRAQITMINC